ncbi:hypothetical protein PRUPE_8G113700 [Prunus persica]|uniref:Uncharacterized protein n=1 Tax=Prunus persica TaxID=3760 RepID=M5VI50_PRUPE|nr:hypothetical protein PRUPE_8G113700 [Prunus persica]
MAGFCKEDDARWLQLEKRRRLSRRRRRSLGLARKTTLAGFSKEDDVGWVLQGRRRSLAVGLFGQFLIFLIFKIVK